MLSNNELYIKDTSGKYIFIRHGETFYNALPKEVRKERITNPKYINSGLNEKGINQSKEASLEVSKLIIEKVYCSPLSRAIETAYYVLENHPQVDTLIVYIHPLLSETINSIQDYISDIQSYKQKYNMNSKVKFDWSIFDSYFPEKVVQDSYVLTYMDLYDSEEKNKLLKDIYAFYEDKNKYQEKVIDCLRLAAKLKKNIESNSHLFERCLKFKSFLKDNHKNVDVDKKILVVAHSTFILLSTSKDFINAEDKSELPKDGYFPDNCKMLSMLIQDNLGF